MARSIVMPSLGMYTAEGTLVRWLKGQGEKVEMGEAIAEIETEKSVYELEAAAAGMLHQVAQVGTNLPVEALIGYVLAEGETPPEQTGGVPGPAAVRMRQHELSPASGPTARVRATPIAKRIAAEHGIDLLRIKGSGPGDRIIEADVLAAIAASKEGQSHGLERKISQRIPLTGMRGTIAERLRHSLSTAASITITREVRSELLVAARNRLRDRLGTDVSYDSLFIKLFAAAVRQHPIFNSSVEDNAIVVFDEVHVGFAVAVPNGLVVPVVHHADIQSLTKISSSVAELSSRAISGHLRPADVSGGSTSISNLGNYGVDAFTPILNPPQSSILGIGRIVERPVVERGTIVPAITCVLSLTFDHRVADGAPAAQLLDSVARKMRDTQYLDSLGECS